MDPKKAQELFAKLEVTDEDFEEFLNNMKIVSKDPSSFVPHIFIMGADETGERSLSLFAIMGLDINDSTIKYNLMNQVGQKLYEDRTIPIAIGLTTEAWMVHRTAEQHKTDTRKPSECEDKKEFIMIAGIRFTKPKDGWMDAAEILERKEEEITKLGEFGGFKKGGANYLLHELISGFFKTVVELNN